MGSDELISYKEFSWDDIVKFELGLTPFKGGSREEMTAQEEKSKEYIISIPNRDGFKGW